MRQWLLTDPPVVWIGAVSRRGDIVSPNAVVPGGLRSKPTGRAMKDIPGEGPSGSGAGKLRRAAIKRLNPQSTRAIQIDAHIE
jgi:hypothetical protein